MQDPYFNRPEVSNSDLTWLKNQLHPRDMPDPTQAYRFGTLIDAMITEPHRVNFYRQTLDREPCIDEEFKLARRMKEAFLDDEFCRQMITGADTQRVSTRRLTLDYAGEQFEISARCKWDIWRPQFGWGGDIKSTTAKNQREFLAAIQYFDYDRQRAWYMDIAGSERDVLIAISKANLQIFKVFINRQSEHYKTGRAKYLELAHKWNLMFGDSKPQEQQVQTTS